VEVTFLEQPEVGKPVLFTTGLGTGRTSPVQSVQIDASIPPQITVTTASGNQYRGPLQNPAMTQMIQAPVAKSNILQEVFNYANRLVAQPSNLPWFCVGAFLFWYLGIAFGIALLRDGDPSHQKPGKTILCFGLAPPLLYLSSVLFLMITTALISRL